MASSGVYATTLKDNTPSYRAGISLQNRHISLGSYSTEELAAEAYRQARSIFNSTLTPEDYDAETHILSFSKFITLLNLRDHHIYIKTPIYLQQSYFFYYIDENTVLTFDIDDLFYYSTHSIMKRGSHLFVADYGMQVNILSRYGIREHAVPGRDYQFANGNPHDLRYGNIIVINPYHGVSKFVKKGKTYYKTKIHLHGDFIVGTYEDEVTAAIAYNKAADIAKRNGCRKDFGENYPEGITNKEYANIYQSIVVSKRIQNYKF